MKKLVINLIHLVYTLTLKHHAIAQKVTESLYQLKLQQGIKLFQTAALSKELALAMELLYEDIIRHHYLAPPVSIVMTQESKDNNDDPLMMNYSLKLLRRISLMLLMVKWILVIKV